MRCMGAVLAIRTVSTATADNWEAGSDEALLEASTRRVQAAFAVLVSRYYKDVYRVVWRISGGHADTEDIVQEAFLRLWAKPNQLREAKALKGWLLRVASNLVMDRFRQKPMQELEAACNVADSTPFADELLTLAYVSKAVNAAIAQLPHRQKLALTLVHFEQMTNIAAAANMEISVDALESLLARARCGLKEYLGPQGKQLLGAMESNR